MRSRLFMCWRCILLTSQRTGPASTFSSALDTVLLLSACSSLPRNEVANIPRCSIQYSGSCARAPATSGCWSTVGGPRTWTRMPGMNWGIFDLAPYDRNSSSAAAPHFVNRSYAFALLRSSSPTAPTAASVCCSTERKKLLRQSSKAA